MAQAQASSVALKNLYHKRLVAPTSSKPCFICHKPSSTVLITPDARDFFYACAGHLKDNKFATPQDGVSAQDAKKAEEDKKRKEELDKEIEKVKKEWEEKQKKKGKGKKEKEEKAAEKETSEYDEKVNKLEEDKKAAEKAEGESKGGPHEGPKVFVLHRYAILRAQECPRRVKKLTLRQEHLSDAAESREGSSASEKRQRTSKKSSNVPTGAEWTCDMTLQK